jgi:hypothetical protein
MRLVGAIVLMVCGWLYGMPQGHAQRSVAATHNLDAAWPISSKVDSRIVTFPSVGDAAVMVPARFNLPKRATASSRVAA